MKPLVRWTVGPVKPAGYECLIRSILSFQKLYDADLVICQNGHPSVSSNKQLEIVNQNSHPLAIELNPIGVAWKLCPPRLNIDRHEIFIDNDLILESRISEIDTFLNSDCTLLLEGESRNYGRFEKHVPNGYSINSGLFGMPPGFDLAKFIRFYGSQWENNAGKGRELSATFDEQGLIATALLSYRQHAIISRKTITNCEFRLEWSQGMHFVGLNRRPYHKPWQEYKNWNTRIYI